MKNCCVSLLGLVLLVGGCASATRVNVGPVQVAGQVQVFETSQAASFDLNPNRIGFTVGRFGCSVQSRIGSCSKVVGFSHSTGDSAKVFVDVPALD